MAVHYKYTIFLILIFSILSSHIKRCTINIEKERERTKKGRLHGRNIYYGFGYLQVTWFKTGLWHRIDGPALILYDDGIISHAVWYLNNRKKKHIDYRSRTYKLYV